MNNNPAGSKLEIGKIFQTKSNIVGILKTKKSVKTKAGVTELLEIVSILSGESYFIVESEILNCIRKYTDLGIEVAIKESLDYILGTYAWDINKKKVVRIIDVNNIGINCEVGVGTIDYSSVEKKIEKGLSFPASISLSTPPSTKKTRYYEETYYTNLNSIFLLKPGSLVKLEGSELMWVINKFLPTLGEISVRKFLGTDKNQDGNKNSIVRNINHINCFPELLEIREQNTIDLVPILTLTGEKTNQHIYKEAKKLQHKKLTIGDVISFSKVKDTLNSRYVATVVEEPCDDNFHYVGVLPMNREVLELVTLLSGKQGVYLNPEDELNIITHGRNYAPQPNENVIVNKPFKNFDLRKLNNKILQQDQDVAPTKIELYSYEQPYVVEFEKDIGGHSSNGKGKAGHCISVEKRFIGAPRNNAKALATLLKNQKLMYISDRLYTEEVKCTDAELEKLLPSKSLEENQDKFIGIIFAESDDAEIKLDKDVPNHILIYSSKHCAIIPIDCIEFVETSSALIDTPEVKGRVQILKNMFGSKESKKPIKQAKEADYDYAEFAYIGEQAENPWPIGEVQIVEAAPVNAEDLIYDDEEEHDND